MEDDKETNPTSKEDPVGSITTVNVSAAEGVSTGAVDGAPFGFQVNCLIVVAGPEQVKAAKTEEEKTKDKEKQLVSEIEEQGRRAESGGEGEALKGCKVKKKFGRKKFMGEVTEYDAENRWYHVSYEDGDEEDLSWAELEPVLLPS